MFMEKIGVNQNCYEYYFYYYYQLLIIVLN